MILLDLRLDYKWSEIYIWNFHSSRSEVYNVVAREGRVYHKASQGQRDFLLAINLSSLVGVRLDVIQLVTYERIICFQASDCHRRQSCFIHEDNDVYPVTQVKQKRTANSTKVDSTSGWKSSLGKTYKQDSARARRRL